MEKLLKDIEDVTNKKYLEIKDLPDVEMEIEKIFRDIRWKEPELAMYVKKKMMRLSKGKGNS